jgi:hypothetical protein
MAANDRTTYYVEWIKDLPNAANSTFVAVELWAVMGDGKKVRIRSTNVEHMRRLRQLNNVPTQITDVSFLAQGLDELLAKMGFDHFELAVAPMSPKKNNSRTLEFPANALEQGTTHASNIGGSGGGN